MIKLFKYSYRTLGIIIFLFLFTFVTLTILIQQPKVQTWAVQKAAALLSEKFGSKVSVGSVDIKFIKDIELQKIFLEDKNHDTLFYANKISANLLLGKTFFSQLNAISQNKIYVDDIKLEGITFYGYRTQNDSLFNFSNILEALKSDKKTKPKKKSNTLDLKLNHLQLTNLNLVLDDQYGDNGFKLKAKKLDFDINKLDLNQLLIDANTVYLDSPDFTLTLYNQKENKHTKVIKPFQPQNLGLWLNVDDIQIKNGRYAMNMLNRKNIKVGNFQISYMDINSINLNANEFVWDTTGLHANIKNINTVLEDNIHVKRLSGVALLDNKSIQLSDATIELNQSKLKGDLALYFLNDWKDFKYFDNNVIMDAKLTKSTVSQNDIIAFVPSIKKYLPRNAIASIDARGPLNNLKINQIDIFAGKNTHLNITGNIKGLPKIKNTLFDLYVNEIATNTTDLDELFTFIKLPKQLSNAGKIKFNGDFKGYIDDFYTKGNLYTDNLGKVNADLHLRFPKGSAPLYEGKLIAHQVNLAELTGNKKLLGTIDLDMNANGNGLNINNINTKLVGKVKNFYLNGFVFDEIDINGILDKKKFTGKALYDDGCFLIDFDGMADFNEKIPRYDFNIDLKNINLKELNFAKEPVTISLNGSVKAQGNHINNINGGAELSNIIIQNEKNILTFSDLTANLESRDNFKHYRIDSKEMDVDIMGNFNPLTLVPSAKVYLHNYTTLIKPTEKELKNNQLQDIKAKIKLQSDFGGIFKVFVPKLNYVSDLNIDANFNNSINYLSVTTDIDSINYDKIALSKIQLDAYNNEKDLLSELSIKNLKTGKVSLDDLFWDLNSNLDQLLSSISIEPNTSKNGLQMVSTLNFRKDTIITKILDSKIKLNNKFWNIGSGNQIVIYDSIFETNNIKLVQGDQEISIKNGRNTLSDLNLSIKNLNVTDFAQIIDTIGAVKNGTLTGIVNLKNILKKPEVHGDLVIRSFQVLDYKVDYIGLDAVYGKGGKNIAEFGGILQDPNYQLQFNGLYDMQKKGKELLDVDAIIDKVDLSFIQSLIKNEVSIKNAFVKGNVKVSGNLKKIVLNGNATFLDTADVKLKFLGTTFKIPTGESIALTKEGFDFGTITVFDDVGNNASLSGKLTHEGFKNFAVGNAVFNAPLGYHFMSTRFEDNQDFYGEVYASGNATINGPFENLKIDVNAQTLAKTVFNLPVSGKSSKASYSYIMFFDPNDTTKVVEEKVKLHGITIGMNIIATPDAEVNIVLDQSTGDRINGRGSGDITLNLDKSGKLDLNGTYTISKGNYNFKFQNVISKNFIVKSGSSVTFAGNPMDAILDINAVYNVNASIRNLLSDIDTTNKSLMNKSIPIDLNLIITNTLSKPDINFYVSPTNSSLDAQTQEITQMLEKINSNKTEVYNQAFGLLLFNGFIPLLTGGAGEQQMQGFSNSITQFFTQQISNLFTKGLEQIGLKGASLDVLLKDIESKESRQFGFSYKQELFNSRLIFTVGGNVNFGNGTNTDLNNINKNNNSTFTSDFVLEYLITSDGRIRLKTFAKTGDFDIINQDRVRTGGAIAFQKDFDNLKDLFQLKKNKK